MRILGVIVLALVAIAAAGLWGLAQFGHPQVMVAEEHAPAARAAADGAAAAPSEPIAPDSQPAPAAAHANPPATLKTDKATDAQAAEPPVEATAAAPQPEPAAADEPAPAPAEAAEAAPEPAAPAATPAEAAKAAEAAARKALNDQLAEAKSGVAKSAAARVAAARRATAPRAAAPENLDAPGAAAPPPPPPPPAPAAEADAPQSASASPSMPAPAASAPATAPKPVAPDTEIAQPASVAAPAASASTASSLAEEFKTRKIAYNRPPHILYLDTPIDISLVIDATAAQDPAAQLQGFPGDVVKRDVELSNTVSAQLTGVGFDIVTQTVARQSLSSKIPNRWQWRVTPTEPGTHTLMLDIFGYKADSLDAEPLDAYRDQITVEVRQLDAVIKWAKGIQPVFAVVAAIAGALSALMAFLRFRREGRKKG